MASITIYSYWNLLVKLTRNCEPTTCKVYKAMDQLNKVVKKQPLRFAHSYLNFLKWSFRIDKRQKSETRNIPLWVKKSIQSCKMLNRRQEVKVGGKWTRPENFTSVFYLASNFSKPCQVFGIRLFQRKPQLWNRFYESLWQKWVLIIY